MGGMASIDYFRQGYNCGQAVLLAHGAAWGLDARMARHLGAPLGAGGSGLRRTCGALSALFLLAGMKHGDYDVSSTKAKNDFYAFVRQLDAAFARELGSSQCCAILKQANCPAPPMATARDDAYYALRPCERCLFVADEIYEAYLKV